MLWILFIALFFHSVISTHTHTHSHTHTHTHNTHTHTDIAHVLLLDKCDGRAGMPLEIKNNPLLFLLSPSSLYLSFSLTFLPISLFTVSLEHQKEKERRGGDPLSIAIRIFFFLFFWCRILEHWSLFINSSTIYFIKFELD